MKLRPLTSATRVALAIARGIAASRGDRDLTPIHIALGIFREGTNPGIAAVWYAGMPESDIRRFYLVLDDLLGDAPGQMPPRLVAIESSAGEEEVLRLGELEAEQYDSPYLGTEHLLLAILRDGGPVADKIREYGVSVDKYVEGMSSMWRGDPPPGTPTAL